MIDAELIQQCADPSLKLEIVQKFIEEAGGADHLTVTVRAGERIILVPKPTTEDEAMQLIAFMSDPENQKLLPPFIPYGPTNKDAAALVDPAVLPNIPSSPQNIDHGLFFNGAFWVDRVEDLNARFNAWAAQ